MRHNINNKAQPWDMYGWAWAWAWAWAYIL